MVDVQYTPPTPQVEAELGIRAGSEPHHSNPSPTTNQRESPEDAQRLAKSLGRPPSYFGKLTKPALQRLNGVAADEDDDETRSTTTDITELSNTAQAGSVTPSSPAESTEEEIEGSAGAGEEKANQSDADASPFWNQNHSSAEILGPPKVNLAPRTHPLAGQEAEHGGVLLCEDTQANMDDERATGARAPAYNDAVEFKPSDDSEDNYSSDEQNEGGVTKRLVRRVKGGAKAISGRIRSDPERG
ncbi:hypothetical protein B0H12DRAFT_1217339 [Mycena haematopus]|nr:hypothetical protein B0H12DRAFT_1217339 [Mycena haematopus]